MQDYIDTVEEDLRQAIRLQGPDELQTTFGRPPTEFLKLYVYFSCLDNVLGKNLPARPKVQQSTAKYNTLSYKSSVLCCTLRYFWARWYKR